MRVLQINASDSLVGGASRVAMDLMQGYSQSGVDVEMFVGTKFSTNSNIYQIPKSFVAKLLSFILANDIDFFSTDYIIDTPSFASADIIQCHNLHGWYFNLDTVRKMSVQKPVVWTLHDMWSVTPHCSYAIGCGAKDGFYSCPSLKVYPSLLWHNEKHLIRRKREIYQNAEFSIVVPSFWLKNILQKSMLKEKEIRVIYNGVDTKVFKPRGKAMARYELGLPADKKIVLFLSSLGKANMFKGGQYLEAIARKYSQREKVIFLCVGNKPKNQSKDESNIIYLDKTSDKSLLSNYYSASDVFLFTSLADNFPLVILEAMACGLPVVAFDVGGVKEAVEHQKNGYIAEYKNLDDLAKGLEYIFGLNPDEYRAISEFNRRKVEENYTLEIMTNNYLNYYQEILSRHV